MTLEIRTLGPDEKITEAGAYSMSMAQYHSQCCVGPSISSTGIRKAAIQSPHAFWKTSDLNPDRYPERPVNDSLILGRAAHALILGDEVFDEHFIFVPDDAPRRPTAPQIKAFERDGKWSAAAAEGAAFWTEFDKRAKGRLELTAEQVQKIQWMSENIAANPLAVENLTAQLTEISMIWQDETTGLWIKSRPDCIPDNGYNIADLKTFAPKGADLELSAHRAVTDHGYALQMALAIEATEQVFGITAEACLLVFCQTSEPYEVISVEIDQEALYWARVLNREGMDRISHGLTTGDWPGRVTGASKYSYPPSLLHRFGEMQINGQLPAMER